MKNTQGATMRTASEIAVRSWLPHNRIYYQIRERVKLKRCYKWIKIRIKKVDLVIIAETNMNIIGCDKEIWLTDRRQDTATDFLNNERNLCKSAGYTWTEVGKVWIYSCYAFPNGHIQTFNEMLQDLSLDLMWTSKKKDCWRFECKVTGVGRELGRPER